MMKDLIVGFDSTVSGVIQGRKNMYPIMRYVTHFGDTWLIISISMTVIVAAFRLMERPELAKAFMASLAIYAFGGLLKLFVKRTRPDTLYVTTMRFRSFSFPSGHSLGALLVYGLLAWLSLVQLSGLLAVIVAGALGLLAFLVGVSRIYLGAHFPTDVLGGWIIGGLSLFLLISTFLK